MNEDAEHDAVDDDLFRMGLLDERDSAIERAEAEGVEAEVPEFSSAKIDAMVAASLQAAGLEDNESSISPSRRWVAWTCGSAIAVAAAVLLWRSPSSGDDPAASAGPLPAAQLKLGGTARTLGDAPPVRPYGPGDAFFLELSFDQPLESSIVAELFAVDSEGLTKPVTLPAEFRGHTAVFEGEIAELLAPGLWTLQVRYGDSRACSTASSQDCDTLEERIEVVAP